MIVKLNVELTIQDTVEVDIHDERFVGTNNVQKCELIFEEYIESLNVQKCELIAEEYIESLSKDIIKKKKKIYLLTGTLSTDYGNNYNGTSLVLKSQIIKKTV